jgi:eukaryotic-like serine/threonine-protein kinase
MESPPKSRSSGIFGQVAPERLGKYPLLSVIGTGSMGVVYKSYDPQMRCAVALKTVRSELLDDEIENFSARFRIEALAAGSLTHPGIVRVYEHGEAEGYAYIAMEYVEGHSLRDCFERKVRFNSAQAINILSQLLKALQHAHEHGVWHRDVKPGNILLLSDGQIKVTDFGIARVESLSTPQANTIMGTPGFIAPELYLSEAFDHRIDLFAAGVVFYQLLTGVVPFVGTPEKVMFRVCYETPLPVSVVARQPSLRPFDAVVLKALSRSPEDRFASAAEFLEALVLAQAGGSPGADETVMFARRAPQAAAPAITNETLMLARRPPQDPAPPTTGSDETLISPRRADETLMLPRELWPEDLPPAADKTLMLPRERLPTVGPSITDETLMSARRSSQTSRLASADQTLMIPRRAVPDDPNLTIIRAIPTETPVTEPLLPLRAAEPEFSEKPPGPPPVTSALRSTPSTTAGWNPQALTQIEKQLAQFLGPIARVLVRTATHETSDLVSLIQWLAAKISIAPDREAFLRGASVVSADSLGRSNSDTKGFIARAGSGLPLTPDYIARAGQLLAVHLGPIAQILARRAAQQGSSQEQFVATLATHLSDDRERARFLKALG